MKMAAGQVTIPMKKESAHKIHLNNKLKKHRIDNIERKSTKHS